MKKESNSNLVKPGEYVKWSHALVTNQIFVSAPLSHTKEKRKGSKKGEKAKTTKAKISYQKSDLIKSYWSMMIMHIIFDLMGNDLQSQSMTHQWFGIKMKYFPVWDFIHLERFSSIRLDPVILLMFF